MIDGIKDTFGRKFLQVALATNKQKIKHGQHPTHSHYSSMLLAGKPKATMVANLMKPKLKKLAFRCDFLASLEPNSSVPCVVFDVKMTTTYSTQPNGDVQGKGHSEIVKLTMFANIAEFRYKHPTMTLMTRSTSCWEAKLKRAFQHKITM